MGALLALIGPLLGGIFQPIKDFISFKSQEVAANRDLQLARISAEKEATVSGNLADTARLNSTSQSFKQHTFWLLIVPVVFSVAYPARAEVMWHNLSLMPEGIQYLLYAVYSSIWGLPILKNGFGSFMDLMSVRTNNKVTQIKALNEAVVAASLRKTVFKQGMTQAQWDAIMAAVKEGQEQ